MGFLRSFKLTLENCGKDKYIEKGHVYGPVISSDYIMQYCFAGCGEFTIDDISYRTKKGDCVVVFPGQKRTEKADDKAPWRHIWLSFRGESAKLLFEKMGASKDKPVIHGFDHTKLPYIMQELVDIIESPELENPFMLGEKIYSFFGECIKLGEKPEELSAKELYVNHAVNYFDMHFQEMGITVERLADDIGITRSYFYSVFKEIMGVSPKEYLNACRIKKAKELLKIPGATVTSVAYSVGYEPSVFTKAFKNVCKISPSEYKENYEREEAEKDDKM